MALYQDKKTKKWCYRLSKMEDGKQVQKHSKWYNLKKEATSFFINQNLEYMYILTFVSTVLCY